MLKSISKFFNYLDKSTDKYYNISRFVKKGGKLWKG